MPSAERLNPSPVLIMIYCESLSDGGKFKERLAELLAHHGLAAGEWNLMVVDNIHMLRDAHLIIALSRLQSDKPDEARVIDIQGATEPTKRVIKAIKNAAEANQ